MIPLNDRKQYELWLKRIKMNDSEAMRKMYTDYINEYIEQNAKSDVEKKIYKEFITQEINKDIIEDIDNIVISKISGKDISDFAKIKIVQTITEILLLQHKSRQIINETLVDFKDIISKNRSIQYAMVLRDIVLPAYEEAYEPALTEDDIVEISKEDIEVKALNNEEDDTSPSEE